MHLPHDVIRAALSVMVQRAGGQATITGDELRDASAALSRGELVVLAPTDETGEADEWVVRILPRPAVVDASRFMH